MVLIMNQAVTVPGGVSFLLTALWLLLRSHGPGARLVTVAVVFEQHFLVCFPEAAAFGLNPQGSSELSAHVRHGVGGKVGVGLFFDRSGFV